MYEAKLDSKEGKAGKRASADMEHRIFLPSPKLQYVWLCIYDIFK